MCRNIKQLFNFEPPATDEEVYAASLQFVRKVSGMQKPSHANEKVFERAVLEVQKATRKAIDELEANSTAKNREVEAEKVRRRNQKRFMGEK
ncbi:MAG: DUF2277 domain-containing protein [Pyrinomonadaceae bacterium]